MLSDARDPGTEARNVRPSPAARTERTTAPGVSGSSPPVRRVLPCFPRSTRVTAAPDCAIHTSRRPPSRARAGQAATSLETYLPSEGIGQLYLRLLTGNFEEATRARKEGRPPRFTDGS